MTRGAGEGGAPRSVVVVGLGSAGAAAAAACASRGLSVIGLERGSLARAGARWVNGVPRWALELADVPVPEGDHHIHLVAGWGPRKVAAPAVVDVDMRELVATLHARARAAGAELREGVVVREIDARGVVTADGRVDADVIVDARGLAGRRRRHPREHLCVAAQEVRTVADPQAAARWLAAQQVMEGEAVCFSGVAGGYSIVNVRVLGDEVHLLAGSIPDAGHPSGRALLREFRQREAWIGELRFGGSGAIPLGPGEWPLADGNVARVGDAGGQVFASHGSGVAMQLGAAELLADALVDGGGPVAYDVAFQRKYGGLLASSDLFRRFSQTLEPSDLAALIEAGVLAPEMMADALHQRPTRPPLGSLARAGAGLARMPSLARRIAPVLARMRLVEAHQARYPADPARRERWGARRRWLLGD
jgi:flavin-dependent dehydrogenase